MKRLKSLRVSPSMVVAMLALFVALGGSAYAATKIGTKQIKSNAITTAKIKKNAVTSAKIKNGAVTGSKINLSTVGTVPSATHATTADSATKANEATTAQTAVTATNFSRYFATGLKKASVGQSIPLISVGPFTFTGVCEAVSGNEYAAYVVTTTNTAGSFFSSADTEYRNANFEPGVEAFPQEYYAESTEAEYPGEYGFSYYNEFTAASPSGNVLLHGQANSGVHVFGADCAYEVHGTNNA